MDQIGIGTLMLLGANIFVSYKGINSYAFLNQYSFKPYSILVHKDYKRLITSGFLHANWPHLIFNMVALYMFGPEIENHLGFSTFVLLYFGSLIGGNFLALYIHRNHSDYSAVGASGAISGLVFSAIALFPDMELSLLFIPLWIPGWLFGFLYVLYSLYGIRSQRDNIGHEAHLGGGITGLIITIFIDPLILKVNTIAVLLMLIPAGIFLYLIATRPDFLIVNNPFSRSKGLLTVDDTFNTVKQIHEKELDSLLDKISRSGYSSLTKQEKERLEKLSNSKK